MVMVVVQMGEGSGYWGKEMVVIIRRRRRRRLMLRETSEEEPGKGHFSRTRRQGKQRME